MLAWCTTVNVSVAAPGVPGDTLTLLGLMPALTPRGNFPTLRLTVPANPLADATLIVLVAVGLVDLLTVRLAGFAVIVNDPPGVTVTVTDVAWASVPLVPVTVRV